METTTDKYLNKLKNNPIVAVLIILFIVLLNLLYFCNEVKSFFSPNDNSSIINIDNSQNNNNFNFENHPKTQAFDSNAEEEDKLPLPQNNVAEKVELSIQLQKKFNGSKEIFFNGELVYPLETSTRKNPRIIVSLKDNSNYEIQIITNSNDTCLIQKQYLKNSSSSISRIIPNCQ